MRPRGVSQSWSPIRGDQASRGDRGPTPGTTPERSPFEAGTNLGTNGDKAPGQLGTKVPLSRGDHGPGPKRAREAT